MRVRSELSGRRLLVGLVLLAALPLVVATVALSYSQPPAPPGAPAYNPLRLTKEPVLKALHARELQRSRRINAKAPGLGAPILVPATFPVPLPTLLVAPRAEPWTLAELRERQPAAFADVGDALLVRANVEVPEGARLIVDSATTPDVRLLSQPSGFAAVIAKGGVLELNGTPDEPVRVTSWDAVAGERDTVTDDGRAFLLAWGGRMDMSHADVGHLGFGTGTTSGAAWRGGRDEPADPGEPAVGRVVDSRLHHNWFGAYTFEAEGMLFRDSTFAHNAAYGFDPHDLSNDFLVVGNVAHGNGRHGFIFSRGCDRNVLRDNVSYDNRGHGFMIDDGRSEDSPVGEAARLPSDDNVLVGNHAYDNDGSGIEIEGGTGTVVEGNLLERNHVGVRVKNDASVRVADNRVVDSRLAGIDVMEDAGQVRVVGNEVQGGWAGLSLASADSAALEDNELRGSSTALVVGGEAQRETGLATSLKQLFRWNPLLVLWTAILGLPLLVAVRGVVRAAAGPVRRTGADA